MAGNIRWQMNCCLCCGCPTEPSRESMRRDKIVARSLNFIEGDAIRNASLWNLPNNVVPILISEKQNLHLFHTTNVLPVIKAFFNGVVSDMWVNNATPRSRPTNFPANMALRIVRAPGIPAEVDMGQPVPIQVFKLKAVDEYVSVEWRRPRPLPGYDVLANLVRDCIVRVGRCRALPNANVMVPGCKMCNDIMTQQGTTSHFLVRKQISDAPLVDDRVILTHRLVNNGTTYSNDNRTAYRYDPADDVRNRRGREFNYQGCLAYYIHRCLPPRPGAANLPVMINVRKIMAALGFIILEIVSLTYERYQGKEGGTSPNVKPAFRYRGCTELYISYVFWVLFGNDNAEGEPDGVDGRHCSLDFCQFHRYMFSEVIPTLVVCHPNFADAFELGDALFGDNENYLQNGMAAAALRAGQSISPPDVIMGFVCNRICQFYNHTLKPIFSRHIAHMEPNLNLITPGHAAYDITLYARQIMTSNMIISVSDLENLMHLMEKATIGDIDTFVECVGSHAVFWLWQRLLEMAPVNTERLMKNFMDSLTLIEYKNIQMSMSTDPNTPAVTDEYAESIYVMCNALILKTDVRCEEDLWKIKSGPICSPPKSAVRLIKVGAFRSEE